MSIASELYELTVNSGKQGIGIGLEDYSRVSWEAQLQRAGDLASC